MIPPIKVGLGFVYNKSQLKVCQKGGIIREPRFPLYKIDTGTTHFELGTKLLPMGIKRVNRYLTDHCSKKAIFKTNLKIAEGKTIVIDTSIYMYKYMSQNALIEYIYLMISILLEYNITPIFIFDGKAPPEKRDLLRERSKYKKDAEKKYNELQKEIENPDVESHLKKDIIDELESLKKRFIRIKEKDIIKVKKLMDAYGVSYIVADGEADKLCAFMVKHGNAWACLSDDMDLFVYGCPRVLRHMSLLKHTIIMYDFHQILNEIGFVEESFREIMVLSGTDYNINQKISLYDAVNWFNEYVTFYKNEQKCGTFYKWLCTKNYCALDYDELLKIHNMFCLIEDDTIYINIKNLIKSPNYAELKNILREDGFVSC
jgi:5'-3' exonuclease